jgi:hypothetical protein
MHAVVRVSVCGFRVMHACVVGRARAGLLGACLGNISAAAAAAAAAAPAAAAAEMAFFFFFVV